MGKLYKIILLADDDHDDHLLFKEALNEADASVVCMSYKSCSPAYQNDSFDNGPAYHMKKPNNLSRLCSALKSIVIYGIPQLETISNYTL